MSGIFGRRYRHEGISAGDLGQQRGQGGGRTSSKPHRADIQISILAEMDGGGVYVRLRAYVACLTPDRADKKKILRQLASAYQLVHGILLVLKSEPNTETEHEKAVTYLLALLQLFIGRLIDQYQVSNLDRPNKRPSFDASKSKNKRNAATIQ